MLIINLYNKMTFFTSFMIGFLGSFHCLGMCGFFSMLFFFNEKKKNVYVYKIFCNFGRIFSYILIGIFFWFFGFLLNTLFGKITFFIFKIFSGLILIFYYFYIKKIIFFNYFFFFEKKLISFWKKLFVFNNNILVNNFLIKYFFYGVIWGFIPCGLVYTAVLYSFSSESVYFCFFNMFFFGLGTLPSMLMIFFFSENIKKIFLKYKFFLEIFILLFGIYIVLFAFLNYGKC